MKKIILMLAVMCLTAMTAIGFVSCNNNSTPTVIIPATTTTVIAQYKGTVNGKTDVITINSDGTWKETWSGDGNVYTSGTYTIKNGDAENGTIAVKVTYSAIASVPVGTTTDIAIGQGQFTFNGTLYIKF